MARKGGGHPRFLQSDPRAEPQHRALGHGLLHLGFGDAKTVAADGELTLMIALGDLQARDFDRAVCLWDCD
jgi:uncharacterized protein YwqG